MRTRGLRAHRHAFSVVECVVVGALAVVLLGVVHSFSSATIRWSSKTVGIEEANRSVIVAVETIRKDLSRILVRYNESTRKNEGMPVASGSKLSFEIMTTAPGTDFSVKREPVRFSLQPSQSNGKLSRLVRSDSKGSRTIAGCALTSMAFAVQSPRSSTGYRFNVRLYLTVPKSDKESHQVVVELPCNIARLPPSYPWKPKAPA